MLKLHGKLFLSNDKYELAADAHRRHREFNEGDYVLVRVNPEHFPKDSVKKLHARTIGPFPILRRVGSIAYLIGLP